MIRNELSNFFDPAEKMLNEMMKGFTKPNLRTLKTDISETDTEYVFDVDMAGIKKEDISVEIDNGILVIEAKRETVREGLKIQERHFGSFYRTFALPENIDTESIKAKLTDGVLEIRISKKQEDPVVKNKITIE